MMADFVSDNIGLREVARCAKASLQFLVEIEIKINTFVFRTIKGPDRSTGKSTSRIYSAGKQHELRLAISHATLAKQVIPHDLGIAKRDGNVVLKLFLSWRNIPTRVLRAH